MQSKSIGLRGSESSSRLQHHAALRNPVRRPMNRALNLKNRFDSFPPPLKATRNAHHLPSQAQLRWLPLIWVKYCYFGSKKKKSFYALFAKRAQVSKGKQHTNNEEGHPRSIKKKKLLAHMQSNKHHATLWNWKGALFFFSSISVECWVPRTRTHAFKHVVSNCTSQTSTEKGSKKKKRTSLPTDNSTIKAK